MATQSAAVHNEHIKSYVAGLRARGKPYKCAIVAAMRKMLIYLQSLLKNPEKAELLKQEKNLVLCHILILGYSDLSFSLASSILNCQSTPR